MPSRFLPLRLDILLRLGGGLAFSSLAALFATSCLTPDFNFGEEPKGEDGSGGGGTPVRHCENGQKDEDETDIDCGGSCSPCEADKGCVENSDCIDNACIDKVCAPPCEEDRCRDASGACSLKLGTAQNCMSCGDVCGGDSPQCNAAAGGCLGSIRLVDRQGEQIYLGDKQSISLTIDPSKGSPGTRALFVTVLYRHDYNGSDPPTAPTPTLGGEALPLLEEQSQNSNKNYAALYALTECELENTAGTQLQIAFPSSFKPWGNLTVEFALFEGVDQTLDAQSAKVTAPAVSLPPGEPIALPNGSWYYGAATRQGHSDPFATSPTGDEQIYKGIAQDALTAAFGPLSPAVYEFTWSGGQGAKEAVGVILKRAIGKVDCP